GGSVAPSLGDSAPARFSGSARLWPGCCPSSSVNLRGSSDHILPKGGPETALPRMSAVWGNSENIPPPGVLPPLTHKRHPAHVGGRGCGDTWVAVILPTIRPCERFLRASEPAGARNAVMISSTMPSAKYNTPAQDRRSYWRTRAPRSTVCQGERPPVQPIG